MSQVYKLKGFAEHAALPSSTPALRAALDVRFQSTLVEIDQIASSAGAHGLYPLTAIIYTAVQASPGSSDHVTVLGLDASPIGLAIDFLNIQTMAYAQSAVSALNHTPTEIQSGLQRNCYDFSALGVDAGCGMIERVCRSEINSTGDDAWLTGHGPLVAGDEDFLVLKAEYCPFNNLGWFVMGQHTTDVPFGNGSLCIDRSAGAIYRLSPGTLINGWNEAQLSLTDASSSFSSLIQPGSVWYFQFLFKDAQAQGVNSTNALRVTFEP